MAIAQFLEGTAFGVLNDVLSAFRSNEGYALPSRYEIVINAPAKIGGGQQENIFANKERSSDSRTISLRAESVILPGRTLTTSTDSNIYGPDREIVEGVTFADEISIDFQASSGLNLDANQTGTDVTGRIFNTVIRGVERNISRNVPRLLNLL